MKPWITYTLIRVGIFAAVFGLLFGLLNVAPWLAALIAAVVGLSVSYLFFRGQRDAAVASLGAKSASVLSDEEAEG